MSRLLAGLQVQLGMFGVGGGRRRRVGRVGAGHVPDVAGVHGRGGRGEVRQVGQGRRGDGGSRGCGHRRGGVTVARGGGVISVGKH